MRTRPRTSLLLATLFTAAIPACAARAPDPAAPTSDAQTSGPDGAAPSSIPSNGAPSGGLPAAANPAEPAAHSSGVSAPDANAAADLTDAVAARRAAKLEFVTGVALSSAGALAALMGGVFLGRSGGFCHSYQDSCGASVAVPITGALWIGAGVVPLILGVTILVPRVGAAPSPPASPSSGATAAARPTVFIGPASAGVRIPF